MADHEVFISELIKKQISHRGRNFFIGPVRVVTENPLPERTGTDRPLIVDLDGTLLKTDLLWESILVLFKQNPLIIFFLPIWLLKGRAFLKRELSRRVSLDVGILPYHCLLYTSDAADE